MTEIDRRSLMTLAGAGLLMVSGAARAQCVEEEEPDTGAGGCEQHGHLATADGPTFDAETGSAPTFDPKYICVLYVRFADDKTLKVRTAYVEPTRPYQVASVVQPILEKMRNNSSIHAIKQTDHLDDFMFGSQHLIVMFVDNDPDNVGFDDRFELKDIVRFTPYRGSNPRKIARKNNAFFNLKRLEFSNQGSLRSRVAYQLEFWNTDDEGRPIVATENCPSSHYIYSMNIHLRMAVRSRGRADSWVPIILDPDTGNMGGQP